MEDLSAVSEKLISTINNALTASPVTSGQATATLQHPQTPGPGGQADVNLYLFHVSTDKFQSNAFWRSETMSGGGGNPAMQPVGFQPLALDLWYLLSVQFPTSAVLEAQALGIAMKALHDNPIITIPDAVANDGFEDAKTTASIIMESPSFDELSRLWQALGVPLRMTAQYRVSVVFLTTPRPAIVPQPNPNEYAIYAAPAVPEALGSIPVVPPPDPLPPGAVAQLPVLLDTVREVVYTAPGTGGPQPHSFTQSPASSSYAVGATANRQVFTLNASGLLETDSVFLITYAVDGSTTELDVTTTWKIAFTVDYPQPYKRSVPALLRPSNPIVAGRYGLAAGRPATSGGWRSNIVPLSIAPWVDPAPGPSVSAAGGVFTVTVRGATPTKTRVMLGTVSLNRHTTAGGPVAGEWKLAGNTLTFVAPSVLPAGQYPIRVIANEVEADPALWAVIP